MADSIQNEAGVLRQNSAGYFHLIWLPGSTNQTAVQQLLETLLQQLQQTGCTRLLSDQRQLGAYKDELVSWLVVDWLPRTVATPYLQRMAILPPTQLYVRMQTTYLFEEAFSRYGLVSRTFQKQEDAIAWLLE